MAMTNVTRLRSAAAPVERLWGRVQRLPFWAQLILLFVASLAIPAYGDDYVTSIAISVLTFAMLGMGLNIVVGYAGLLDLGHSDLLETGALPSATMTVYCGGYF